MPKAFKDYLSKEILHLYGQILKQLWPDFDDVKFVKDAMANPWNNMELKERMRRITESLTRALPSDYIQSIKIITESLSVLKRRRNDFMGIEFIFLPDFVEVNGIEHFELSVKAMEEITQFMSCEFAVRPFIVKYDKRMMDVMKHWSKNKNEHLRRLSSEGCRPRLPWAMALPAFKKDPSQILPILERLKNDPSEYVRRSVANNLNDISKDNPKTAFDIFKKWYGTNKETNALVKHGMRTLLKANYPGSMELLGYADSNSISLERYKLLTPKVKAGDSVTFSFAIKSTSKSNLKIRLEYAIYFKLANGENSKKVFKISERTLEPGQRLDIERSHSFKFITTRKYYEGEHFVSPIINGNESQKMNFQLIKS